MERQPHQRGGASPRPSPELSVPARRDPAGTLRGYVRVAALGDSLTFGVGDPTSTGYRGWARILTEAIGNDHEVSFCNVARAGATTSDVRSQQLSDALEHRPHLASLIVGLNDTLRSTWDPARVREDLLHCAGQLTQGGAVLLTARFHDHGQVLRLPRLLARPLLQRIQVVNDVYDELHQRFGGPRVDLSAHPGVYDREFWTIDRMHPSELGHRALAHEYAEQLLELGLTFEPPGLELDGVPTTRARELRRMCTEGAPWIGRRLRDLAPAATRSAVQRAYRRFA
jgi:lysophospholipase L1-like esterase